jgi:hypothetical protein
VGNLTALQTAWATLPAGATTQKLQAINTMTVAGPPQDITVSVLENFLISNNLLQPVTTYVTKGQNQSALIGCNYLLALIAQSTPVIHTSIPANFAAVQQLGAGLLADPATGVNQGHITALIAIIAPPILWWQANGFSGAISITDLIAAGNLF